jgi:hypothetical protein
MKNESPILLTESTRSWICLAAPSDNDYCCRSLIPIYFISMLTSSLLTNTPKVHIHIPKV